MNQDKLISVVNGLSQYLIDNVSDGVCELCTSIVSETLNRHGVKHSNHLGYIRLLGGEIVTPHFWTSFEIGQERYYIDCELDHWGGTNGLSGVFNSNEGSEYFQYEIVRDVEMVALDDADLTALAGPGVMLFI